MTSHSNPVRWVSRTPYGSLLALLVVTAVIPSVRGQQWQTRILSEENLGPWRIPWRYHPGDDPAWARPDLDDSGWEVRRDIWFEPGDMPESVGTGIGWFRAGFAVDSTLVYRPLAFTLYMRGAADVYIDGRLLATYGKVGASAGEETSIINLPPNPRLSYLTFDRAGRHLLAIRHSNVLAASFHKVGERSVDSSSGSVIPRK